MSCIPVPPSTDRRPCGRPAGGRRGDGLPPTIRATGAPEALRLTERIRGLVAELVALQNEDGGWPWVAGTQRSARGPATA